MITVEIFRTRNSTHDLQEKINEFLDTMPKITIIQILQSEGNDSVTISIFYRLS